jgi:hypothetical protein
MNRARSSTSLHPIAAQVADVIEPVVRQRAWWRAVPRRGCGSISSKSISIFDLVADMAA